MIVLYFGYPTINKNRMFNTANVIEVVSWKGGCENIRIKWTDLQIVFVMIAVYALNIRITCYKNVVNDLINNLYILFWFSKP